jgi:hypothetical protein
MQSWDSHASHVRYIFTWRLHAVRGQPHFTCEVHIYTGDCIQSWDSHTSLVRYTFTRETACSPGKARPHLSGTHLHGRLHAVLRQPDLTCQVHIFTGDCMQSWGSQTSLVRNIFTRETACSPGIATLHLSGTYLHGDCMQSWDSHISLVRYLFTRETACSPGTARLHLSGTRETECSPGKARPHLSGTHLHGRLHAILRQPDLTCQVHIYTGDCMQSWDSHTSIVMYTFTRETACSPGTATLHLSCTHLHGRLRAVLGQPHFTCQEHNYTGDCMQSWGKKHNLCNTYLHGRLYVNIALLRAWVFTELWRNKLRLT